jgi:hypothetical protein
VQAVLAQLPWYQQLALLDKLSGSDARRWYATCYLNFARSFNCSKKSLFKCIKSE